MGKNKAVFLDRDGTVSREIGYIRPEDMHRFALVPGSAEGLRALKEAGYLLILTTNQSGVARGYYPVEQVHTVHAMLKSLLKDQGVALDGIYFCPHHPDPEKARVKELALDCDCRKPRPGMALQAAREWDLDLKRCWVVGDKDADLDLARNAGCRGVLVRTGYGEETLAALKAAGREPKLVAADLKEAAGIILQESGEA